MKGRFRRLVSASWFLGGFLALLAFPALATAQLGDLPVVEPLVPTSADAAVPVPATSELYRVHLAVDGNIPGSVKVLDKLGSLAPVRATISVFQNGLLLTTTPSNEQGRFQLPGLRPGTYSVIGDTGRCVGVFAVEVLPYRGDGTPATPVALTAADEESQDGEMTLDLVLTSCDGTAEDELPPVEPYSYPIMSGGGGGGGGGGGMLLGLAGLAGLAGLGGIGGGGPTSPGAP